MIFQFYKIAFIILIIHISFISFINGMSEKQMKSTGKLLRNSCQPKTKVTDEEIDNMHKGIWNEDPAAKCYNACILVMMKVMKKNGEPDWESAYAQIENLPEARIAPTKATMDACRPKVQATGDKCDDAWKMAKCIYFENPEGYFLP